MSGKSVISYAKVVSAGTGLSRMLGFVREMLMAVFFGTTLIQSAFTVAFAIPNLFRRLFGEGALSAALVPVLTETLEKEDREQANRLISRVMTMLGAALLMIVLGVVLLATAAIEYAPLSYKWGATLNLLRIMMPYMFFICMVAMCMAVLNSFHHFAVPAFTPVVLNIVWILTLIFICPKIGSTPSEKIIGVAWGVLLAGAIQLIVQFPALLRLGISPELSFSWRDEKVRRVLLLMGPAAIAMGVFQVNTFIDRLLALAISDWGAAALRFSERLLYLPLGLFATSMATVLLPVLSRQVAKSGTADIKDTMNTSVRNLMYVTIPATIGLMVLARPVIELAFVWKGGMFNSESSLQTARALLFYAPGLIVFSLYKIFVPAFYAMQDMKTPIRTGMWAVFINFSLNIIFVITWPFDYKHSGLAFATVIASGVNCAMLAVLLHRRIGSIGWQQIFARSCRILVASLLMGICAFSVHIYAAEWTAQLGMAMKAAQLTSVLAAVVAGLVFYFAVASIICREETREILGGLRRR